MHVLVVDGYGEADPNAHVVAAAVAVLESNGNRVDHLSLREGDWDGYMTAAEHAAYETDEPLQADATKTSAALLEHADALLFCYPTVVFGLPARLKSWLERVMVIGVAFGFDDKQRVRPGLTNVRRLGVITTSPHSALATARARDLGRRTILRALRLNCHPLCRRSFVRLAAGAPSGRAADQIARTLRSWH